MRSGRRAKSGCLRLVYLNSAQGDITFMVPHLTSRSGAFVFQDTEKLVAMSSLPKSSQGSAPGTSTSNTGPSNEGMFSPEHIPDTPPRANTPSSAQKKCLKVTSTPGSEGHCVGKAAVKMEINHNVLPVIIPQKLDVLFNSSCDVPSSPQALRCQTSGGSLAAAHTSRSVLLVPKTEPQIQEGEFDQHVHHFQPSRCRTSDGSMAAAHTNLSDILVPKSEPQMQEETLDQHVHHFQPSALSGGKSEFIWPEMTEQVQMFGELSFIKRFLILDHVTE